MTLREVDCAVLLAAGRGSRLRPHTDTVPKPLLPWRGRPTLDHLVDGLEQAGVRRVILVVHHLAEQLEAWAARRSGPTIECVHQDELAGTADALVVVADRLATGAADAPFLMSATDYLLPDGFYAELLRFHAQHDAGATVSLKRLPADELASRSSVRFATDDEAVRVERNGGGGTLLEIVEKPAPGHAPSAIGANLMFVLPRTVLTHVARVEPSPRGEREVQSGINAWLAAGGQCRGLLQPTPPEWTPGDG